MSESEKRDPVIEITPEMLRAGLKELWRGWETDEETVEAIFRKMLIAERAARKSHPTI